MARSERVEVVLATERENPEAFKEASTDLANLDEKFRQGQTAAQSFSERIDGVENELHELRGSVGDVNANLNGMAGRLKDLTAPLRGVLNVIGQVRFALFGISTILGSLGLGKLKELAGEATDFARESLRAHDTILGLELALERTSKTTAEAEGNLAFLKQTAADLGVVITQISDEYLGLDAATKELDLSQDEVNNTFREVIEAGRLLNRSNEQIEKTLFGLSQVASKGTLQMEELRQQIGEQLPIALHAIAAGLEGTIDGFDGTTASLTRMIQNSEIAAEQAIPALGRGLEQLLRTKADDFIGRLNYRLGQIQEALFTNKAAFGEGLIGPVTDAAAAIAKFLQGSEGLAKALGRGTGAGLTAVMEQLAETASALGGTIAGVAVQNAAVLDAWGVSWRDLGRNISEALGRTAGLAGLGNAFDEFFFSISGGLDQAIERLRKIDETAKFVATGVRQTEEETRDAIVKTLDEAANAANLTAEERKRIESHVSDELLVIARRFADRRAELEEFVVQASRLGGEARVRAELVYFEEIKKIESFEAGERAQLIVRQLEEIGVLSATKIDSLLTDVRKRFADLNIKINVEDLEASQEKVDQILLELVSGFDKAKREILIAQDEMALALEKLRKGGDFSLGTLDEGIVERVRKLLRDTIAEVNQAGLELSPVIRKFAEGLNIPTDTLVASAESIKALLKEIFGTTVADLQQQQRELKGVLSQVYGEEDIRELRRRAELLKGAILSAGLDKINIFAFEEDDREKLREYLDELVQELLFAGEKIDPVIAGLAGKLDILVPAGRVATDTATELASALTSQASAAAEAGEAAKNAAGGLEELAASQGKAVEAAEATAGATVKIVESVNDQGEVIKEITNLQQEATQAAKDYAEAQTSASDAAVKVTTSVDAQGNELVSITNEVAQASDKISQSQSNLGESSIKVVESLDAQGNTIKTITNSTTEAGASAESLATAQSNVAAASKDAAEAQSAVVTTAQDGAAAFKEYQTAAGDTALSLEELANQLQSIKESLKEPLEGTNTELSTMKTNVGNVASAVDTLNGKVIVLKVDLSSLDDLEARLRRVTAMVDDLESR